MRELRKAEHVGQREGMLRTERQVDAVVGRRRLQLEIERPAEALAQRQPPGTVDTAAERRVDHQLHATRLVEETLGDDAARGRHDPQHLLPFHHVGDDRIGRRFGQTEVVTQEPSRLAVLPQP